MFIAINAQISKVAWTSSRSGVSVGANKRQINLKLSNRGKVQNKMLNVVAWTNISTKRDDQLFYPLISIPSYFCAQACPRS